MFVFHTLLQEIKENYRRLSVSRAAVQQLFPMYQRMAGGKEEFKS